MEIKEKYTPQVENLRVLEAHDEKQRQINDEIDWGEKHKKTVSKKNVVSDKNEIAKEKRNSRRTTNE